MGNPMPETEDQRKREPPPKLLRPLRGLEKETRIQGCLWRKEVSPEEENWPASQRGPQAGNLYREKIYEKRFGARVR